MVDAIHIVINNLNVFEVLFTSIGFRILYYSDSGVHLRFTFRRTLISQHADDNDVDD